jgi:hypothetical protein
MAYVKREVHHFFQWGTNRFPGNDQGWIATAIYFRTTRCQLRGGRVWSAPKAAARDKLAYVLVRGSG